METWIKHISNELIIGWPEGFITKLVIRQNILIADEDSSHIHIYLQHRISNITYEQNVQMSSTHAQTVHGGAMRW